MSVRDFRYWHQLMLSLIGAEPFGVACALPKCSRVGVLGVGECIHAFRDLLEGTHPDFAVNGPVPQNDTNAVWQTATNSPAIQSNLASLSPICPRINNST